MKKYKLILAYDGTHYGGWQVQPNSTSIQMLVQMALETALRNKTDLTGASRTDAGVHALGQVAHFTSNDPVDTFRLLASLNGLLPADIRVQLIEEVPESFHARYSATGKIYHYHLYLERVINPFNRLYATHIPYKVDLERMQKAAKLLVGTHDFTSFANESHKGTASHDAVRTLKRLDLVEESGGVRLEFEADGFLYKMVRNLTGALIGAACGKLAIEEIPALIAARDRTQAPETAPPQGLFLMKVKY